MYIVAKAIDEGNPAKEELHDVVSVTPIFKAEAMYMLDRLDLIETLAKEHDVGQFTDAKRPAPLEKTSFLPTSWFIQSSILSRMMDAKLFTAPPILDGPRARFRVWVLTSSEFRENGWLKQEGDEPYDTSPLNQDGNGTFGIWRFYCLPNSDKECELPATAIFHATCPVRPKPGSYSDQWTKPERTEVRSKSLTVEVFRRVLDRVAEGAE